MTLPNISRSKRRLRRAPSDMRVQALAAARRLIIKGAAADLTMQAVANAAGVTRPNLSHHFGSLAGLHAAIAEDLVRELFSGIQSLGASMSGGHYDYPQLVDRVFTLFTRSGLGEVLGWLVRSGEASRLKPIRKMFADFIAERRSLFGEQQQAVVRDALILALAAYAESSVGPLLGEILDVPASKRRGYLVDVLRALNPAHSM
jgi:AcrR family transcriptional regulator